MTEVMIRSVSGQDRAAVERLLVANALPLEGLDDHFGAFVVAMEGGELLGVAGLELYGDAALLRSVAVVDGRRGSGLGVLLTDAALARAKEAGAKSLSLLTTTAAAFFGRRGFKQVTWAELPLSLSVSRELTGACPRSAIAMHRPL